jgi:hypothetical protein
LTTIYSELLAAAGTEFLPQAEGEPDGHYLRRLVLAVSKCSDEAWEALSGAAHDWYNAQAVRVKQNQDPEECPGFDGAFAQWEHEHKDDQVSIKANYVSLVDTPDDPNCKIVDAVVDAGWPTGPELPKASSNDVAHQDSQAAVVQEFDTVIKDAFKPYASETKHTATDAVRALVMQHQDWNQSQIAAELEAHGQPVSLGTIATVRSMTLATIAVAKGLGKWVEG